jgi:hypothetical protein
MMQIATNNKVKNEVMAKYSKNFNIPGGGFMKALVSMDIKQSNRSIKLCLDHYIREMLNENTTQACSYLSRSHSWTRGLE